MLSTDTEMGFVPRHIHELKHPHNQKKLDVKEREAAWPLEKVTRQRDGSLSRVFHLDGINELEQTKKMRKNYLSKAFCTSVFHEVTNKGGGIMCLQYLCFLV